MSIVKYIKHKEFGIYIGKIESGAIDGSDYVGPLGSLLIDEVCCVREIRKFITEFGELQGELVKVKSFEDKVILGDSYCLAQDLPESENKKIIMLKKSLLEILDLWIFLADHDIEPIILTSKDNIVMLSGSGYSISVPFRPFKYEWENADTDVHWLKGSACEIE